MCYWAETLIKGGSKSFEFLGEEQSKTEETVNYKRS